ncbi:oxidoreductase [Lottiidibacillus patelloidae]|uniref:Oxidoreductase n=2 Tax=Lottiidibacillus patelloidae TaxID=2670334 RepID=A0A263BSL7_9BACI|nr:oxidoreductase [Lottiidibacillus patelloidae]
MKKRKALVLGATGFVGRQLVNILLQNEQYEEVTVLVRRSLKIENKKLNEQLINFENMKTYQALFEVNDVFCCLGTTIKKAKSREHFEKVDLEYPLLAARLAKESNAEKFLVTSAMGANSKSKFYYNRVKGNLEDKLKLVGLKSLHIFQPSLLLGERDEFRLGERIGALLMKELHVILIGPLKTYRGISGEKVAKSMLNIALHGPQEGVHTYKSANMQETI